MGSKGNKTREFIKEAAYPLFVKKGFKEVTMKDICEVTGLSRGGCIDILEVPQNFLKKYGEDL